MSYLTRIEANLRVLAQTDELKSAHAKHQASNSAYEAEIIHYIDVATVEEVKAKDYQESFEQFREELRVEGKSKSMLTSERNAWAKEREALLKAMSALREDHQKLLEEEFYVGFFTGYA
ncbi:hypothetical protein ACFX13_013609 [Malus domestica]